MKIRLLYTALLAALSLGAAAPQPVSAEDVWAPGGVLELYHNGEFVELKNNLVPAAARSYMLSAALAGASQISTWYVVPFINAVAPTSALTAANFDATLDEFVNYTELTRPAWARDAEAAQAITNTTLAAITIDTGGGSIAGISLMSVGTKGSAAGLCLAAVLFASARAVLAGDVLEFRYTMRANAAA